jgi:hypothetical protein
MDLLQTLLDAPGVYIGTVQDFSLPDDERQLSNARIVVTPEPGRIVHHWRYGAPGAEIVERDTADVRLVGA